MFTVDDALAYWKSKDLLTEKKAQELKSALPKEATTSDHTGKAISIFSAVGGILIGLGVLLFVASNWEAMTAFSKLLILLAATIGTGVAGYLLTNEGGSYRKTGYALLFVNIFIFGASIFLVGQIYNLPLNFSFGSLLWFLATVYFAFALRSRLHLWLSVPLLLLTIGWFWSRQSGFGSELDFLTDNHHSIFSLFPAIGVGLIALSPIMSRMKATQFSSRTLLHWGLFLVIFAAVFGTVDRSVFFGMYTPPYDVLSTVVTVLALALVVFSVITGKFSTREGRAGLLFLTGFAVLTSLLSLAPLVRGIDVRSMYTTELMTAAFSLVFVLFILLVFVGLFIVIWYGTLLRSPVFVNLGMIGLAFAIIVQYFSWFFEQLSRSMAFIIGGILILAVSAILERQRRKIVSAFDTP